MRRCLLLLLLLNLIACYSTQSAGTQVDDAAITALIKAKIAADSNINPFNIDVDTENGVVILQGRVDRARARDQAEELARETEGVTRVINLVKVGGEDGGGGCPARTCLCSNGECRARCCSG